MRFARAVIAVVVLVAGAPADASTAIAVPFDALVAESTAAAFVTPVTRQSVWEVGRIFTYTDVHVDQRVAGADLGDLVRVRTMGGEVGTIGQSVSGEAVLTMGRPSLLFLKPAIALTADPVSQVPSFAVTARAQGQFPVIATPTGDLRVHESSGVGATLAPKGAARPLASETLHELTMADATVAVSRAWQRLHAP